MMIDQIDSRSKFSGRGHPAAGCVLVAVVLALGLAALSSSAQTDDPQESGPADRVQMVREINDLVRQDRRAEALPLCRRFTTLFPDDPLMLFNLACLENTEGNSVAAIEAFSRAVAAGFDDFAGAFSDPDLASLKHDPAMIELSLKHQTDLTKLATARAVALSWQQISTPIGLAAPFSPIIEGTPDIQLTWTSVGLQFVLHAGGPWADLANPENPAPWNGGPGLVITLGIPAPNESDSYRTENHFLFAFGLEKSSPLGAVYLAGQDRWQTIAEMQPKFRLDDTENLEMRAMIPWAMILPYNPIVDDRLGFNAALRLTGQEAAGPVAVLRDPAAFRPQSSQRRVVPLRFLVDSVGEEVFSGRIAHTISGSEPIAFDLVAVSPAAGKARLTVDFLAGPGPSVLPEGPVSGTVDLTPGLNRLTRQADFTALKTGPYLLKAEMEFPTGRTFSWGTTVLHLAPGWREEYNRRIEAVVPREKPTALYHLQSVDKAVATHNPRRGPEAIVTTLNDLDQLLAAADKDGSILPDQGTFLAVYPGPGAATRLCHLYLPPGWKIAAKLNPVLTITTSAHLTGAIARRMGQIYENGGQKPTLKTKEKVGFPVYLVPRLEPQDRRQPSDLAAEMEAFLAWVKDSFASSTVSVAGVDQSAAAALELAVKKPQDLKAMFIFAGGNLEPWPQANGDFVKQRLTGFPTDLPLTWADFIRETGVAGQGPLILDVLRDLGSNLVEVQEVRGGLNYTQVADRTVLWAEGLR